jgi:hypothetical protein
LLNLEFLIQYRNVSVEQIDNFISFDWVNETTVDHILKMKNDEEIHIVVGLLNNQFHFHRIYLDLQTIDRSIF